LPVEVAALPSGFCLRTAPMFKSPTPLSARATAATVAEEVRAGEEVPVARAEAAVIASEPRGPAVAAAMVATVAVGETAAAEEGAPSSGSSRTLPQNRANPTPPSCSEHPAPEAHHNRDRTTMETTGSQWGLPGAVSDESSDLGLICCFIPVKRFRPASSTPSIPSHTDRASGRRTASPHHRCPRAGEGRV
jgi:hypothetical protein